MLGLTALPRVPSADGQSKAHFCGDPLLPHSSLRVITLILSKVWASFLCGPDVASRDGLMSSSQTKVLTFLRALSQNEKEPLPPSLNIRVTQD